MMKHHSKLLALIAALFFLNLHAFAQDSSAAFPWKVTSKKIEKGKYELTFSTPLSDKWELYAPNQKIDIQTTELHFNDSSITQDGGFSEKGDIKEITHPAITDGAIRAYRSPTEWTTTIEFKNKDS